MSHSNLPLLILLAMGNWGNTPSPPNDPNAPDAVGNDGELRLDIDGDNTTFSVQAARLSEGALTIEGEKLNGSPQFILTLDLTDEVYSGEKLDTHALRQAALPVRSGSVLVDPSGQEQPITGGSLRVSQASGSGPWEIDGELALATGIGALSGTIQARVRG